MNEVQVKRIKFLKSNFALVTESFKLSGKAPFVKSFELKDVQLENLPKTHKWQKLFM